MTVVAVDANYQVATDSGVWDMGVAGDCEKLFDLTATCGVPAFAAGCGRLSAVTACVIWLAEGADPEKWPEACKKDDWGEVLFVLPAVGAILTYGSTTPHYGQLHPPLTIGDPAAAGAVLHEMVYHQVDAVQALMRVSSTDRFDSVRGPIRSSAEPSLPRPGERYGPLSR